MGDFRESPKWTLVNDFTIHEDSHLHDRPFMRTCVPKRLDVEITSFEIIRLFEWPRSDDSPDAYRDASYIRFNGTLHDRVSVFDMKHGEVGVFTTLTDATIRAAPKGSIGGKNKATSLDGIGFSGMSSRLVPPGGLMEGEPGKISYLAEFAERDGGEKTPASLTAMLYLDEDKFARLIGAASLGQQPVTIFNA